MSKCKQCVDKTLAFAKGQCVAKTNKLVYTDYPKIPRGHCKPVYLPVIYKGCGTKIRYCTAEELRKMAGPRICDCPHKSEAFTVAKFIGRCVKNAVKAGGTFALIYTMVDMGIWGTPKQTEETFAGICDSMPCNLDPCHDYNYHPSSEECRESMDLLRITPYNPCSCENPIPFDTERCMFKIRQAWNGTIVLLFENIRDFPDNAVNCVYNVWAKFMNKPCEDNCLLLTPAEEYTKPDDCQLREDEWCDVNPCEFNEEELLLEKEEEKFTMAPPCGASGREEEEDERTVNCSDS